MSRTALAVLATDRAGNVRPDAVVNVYNVDDNGVQTTLAVCYQNRSGVLQAGNPGVTDGQGQLVVWLERGSYAWTATFDGATSDPQPFESAPAADGSIDPAWLSAASLTAGPAGPQGPQGPVGPAGADGAQGVAGPQGPKGDAGPAGAEGAQGPAGAAGGLGPAGPEGPQGPAGAAGAQGPQGNAGQSFNWRGAWSAATAYALDDVVFRNGSSYIAVGPVAAGVDPATDDGSHWNDVALQGQVGPAGAQGPQGPQGAAGADGPAGPAGPQGIQGVKGDAGPAGPAGADGAQGPAGPAGAQGPQGAAGPAGPKGINWRGPWQAATDYLANDAVSDAGVSYVAGADMLAASNAPRPSLSWDIFQGRVAAVIGTGATPASQGDQSVQPGWADSALANFFKVTVDPVNGGQVQVTLDAQRTLSITLADGTSLFHGNVLAGAVTTVNVTGAQGACFIEVNAAGAPTHGAYTLTLAGAGITSHSSTWQKLASSGVNWRGTWNSTANYNVGDSVNYLGTTYMATAASTNSAPPSASWAVLGQKGDAGAQGPAGPAGAQGPAGPAGAQGPAGPAGPSTTTGTLAARPAANAVATGALYFATDDHGGTLSRSTGAAWTPVSPGLWGGEVYAAEAQAGNLFGTSRDFAGMPPGIYFIWVRVLGANLSHNIAYLMDVHEDAVQSTVMLLFDNAFQGNRSISLQFGGGFAASVALGTQRTSTFQNGSSHVNISTGGNVTSYAFVIVKLNPLQV